MKLKVRITEVFEDSLDSDNANRLDCRDDNRTFYWIFDEDSGILYQVERDEDLDEWKSIEDMFRDYL